MRPETEQITQRLRAARLTKGIRQAQLSRLAGVPQAQISRIEANAVDLRVSSLVCLAHALDLEVVLVPRKTMPAVQSVMRQMTGPSRANHLEPRPAYTLDGDDDGG